MQFTRHGSGRSCRSEPRALRPGSSPARPPAIMPPGSSAHTAPSAPLDPAGQPPGQVDAGDRAARVAAKEAALARVLAVGDDVLVAGEQADVETPGGGRGLLLRR